MVISIIGIIGGSGFYSLLDNAEIKRIDTPYGKTSSDITIGNIGGKQVAFIARHGTKHEYPPHKIPYKANISALKQLGVTHIIAPTAVGSLKAEIKPGDFVVPDQFINMTHGRDDTFYHGPETTHISSAEPYCPGLRKLITSEGKKRGLRMHGSGTVVVIQGPRFASRAESEMFRNMGFDIISMTQYPECILARELEICYANISIVTDYDTGLKDNPGISPVTIEEVIKVFNQNNERLKKFLFEIIPKIHDEIKCTCHEALRGARL